LYRPRPNGWDRPGKQTLCESEAECFRRENCLCKKMPLCPIGPDLSTSKTRCTVRCNTYRTTPADGVVVLSCYRL
jgi:hypothetical protein